jgi:uncharacterized Rmd1/YagE family protein
MADFSPLLNEAKFEATAFLLGERIDLRKLDFPDRLGTAPLVVPAGDRGAVVVFRYGAVVLFDVPADAVEAFFDRLRPFVWGSYAQPDTEQITVHVAPDKPEGVEGSTVYLLDCSVERIQLVAGVLAKSVALARDEALVIQDFERIEPFAVDLERNSRSSRRAKELLRHIGGTLLREQKIIGRMEVGDKPELLWDRPDLERLYVRLENEFEIRERHLALAAKLNLIARTAQTALDVLQDRRTLRVEWYIVILIVVEILLGLYDQFVVGH